MLKAANQARLEQERTCQKREKELEKAAAQNRAKQEAAARCAISRIFVHQDAIYSGVGYSLGGKGGYPDDITANDA